MTIPLAGAASSALAQTAADPSAQAAIDRARAAYGPLSPEQQRRACRAQTKEDEIVVCAPDDGAPWRVPSTGDSEPASRQATRTGVPRAPQLDRGSCKGKGRLGCIGIGGKAREIYMIDLASIPETPKDSDAEKVAKGEMSDR